MQSVSLQNPFNDMAWGFRMYRLAVRARIMSSLCPAAVLGMLVFA